jgi:hypothetical protein
MGQESEFKMEQFIGIFPNALDSDVCSKFVEWFDLISKQGLTLSSSTDNEQNGGLTTSQKNDEVIFIPGKLVATDFPSELLQIFWKNLIACYDIYYNNYSLDRALESYSFKAHRVQPTGGYHIWHHEHDNYNEKRVLVWMIILEAPKSGGETEFLYQSMRIEPKVGQLLLWPAGFTHKHRGNPPLEGQKTYLTGWFSNCL